MKCPNCNSDSHLANAYWELDDNTRFNIEVDLFSEGYVKSKHIEIVHVVLNKYLNGIYSKDDIQRFIEKEKIFCEMECNNCNKHFTEISNYTYFTHFTDYPYTLKKIFEDEYNKQFVKLFKVDIEKIMNIYADDKINTLHIFFGVNDIHYKRLFNAKDIWYSLPWEKGGGEGFLYDVNILPIILSIVSAFLYDVIKVGYKKAYKKIKKVFMKTMIKIKIPKSSIKQHLRNENIKYNEQILQRIIEEETMRIIDKYIKEIEK